MFSERDELAQYRRLEYPGETAQSWPVAARPIPAHMTAAHDDDPQVAYVPSPLDPSSDDRDPSSEEKHPDEIAA
jgi:hypothetical protein